MQVSRSKGFLAASVFMAWLATAAMPASAAARVVYPSEEGSVSASEQGRFTRDAGQYLSVGQPGPAPYRFQAVYRFPLSDVEQAPQRAELEFWYVFQSPTLPRPAFLRVEHVAADHAGVTIEQSNDPVAHPDAVAEGRTVTRIELVDDRQANRKNVLDVSRQIAADLDADREAATFRIGLVDEAGELIGEPGALVQLFSYEGRRASNGAQLGSPKLTLFAEAGDRVDAAQPPSVDAMTDDGRIRLIASGQPIFGVDLRTGSSPLTDFALESLDQAVRGLTGSPAPRTASAPVTLALEVRESGDASRRAEETYRIRTEGSTIHLEAGSERALLWAVTDFAGRAFDATWPGNGPAHVPGRVDELAVEPMNVEESPGMLYRGFHINGSHDDGPQFHGPTVDWMGRNRMNTKTTHPFHFPAVRDRLLARGIEPHTNAHSYFWLVPVEMAETNPEFFPIVDGERYIFDGHGGVGTQLNVSAEGLPEHIADRARRFFRHFPDTEIFGVWPNDGNRGWSESEGDLALDGPQRGKTWKGEPIYSNRVVHLANEVAKIFADDFPDKLVGTGAYALFREPPTIDVEPNVIIDFTTMGRNYLRPLTDPSDPDNAEVLRQLKGWLDKADNVRIYEYFSSGAIGIAYLPMPAWRAICADVPELAELGVKGMYSELFPKPSNRPALALTQYVFARALWEPGIEFETVLADFCEASYGPGAEPMEKFFLTYDAAIRENVEKIEYNTGVTQLLDALRDGPANEMESFLADAEQRVAESGTDEHAEALGVQRQLMQKIKLGLGEADQLDFVGKNMLHNPGIESDQANAPDWYRGVQSGRYDFAVDNRIWHSGRRSLRIDSDVEKGWARWIQSIPTQAGEKYLFSVWYRGTEDFSGFVWAHQGRHHTDGQIVRIEGTGGQWKRVVLPPLEATGTGITLFLESRAGGTVHFDDAFAAPLLEE